MSVIGPIRRFPNKTPSWKIDEAFEQSVAVSNKNGLPSVVKSGVSTTLVDVN